MSTQNPDEAGKGSDAAENTPQVEVASMQDMAHAVEQYRRIRAVSGVHLQRAQTDLLKALQNARLGFELSGTTGLFERARSGTAPLTLMSAHNLAAAIEERVRRIEEELGELETACYETTSEGEPVASENGVGDMADYVRRRAVEFEGRSQAVRPEQIVMLGRDPRHHTPVKRLQSMSSIGTAMRAHENPEGSIREMEESMRELGLFLTGSTLAHTRVTAMEFAILQDLFEKIKRFLSELPDRKGHPQILERLHLACEAFRRHLSDLRRHVGDHIQPQAAELLTGLNPSARERLQRILTEQSALHRRISAHTNAGLLKVLRSHPDPKGEIMREFEAQREVLTPFVRNLPLGGGAYKSRMKLPGQE